MRIFIFLILSISSVRAFSAESCVEILATSQEAQSGWGSFGRSLLSSATNTASSAAANASEMANITAQLQKAVGEATSALGAIHNAGAGAVDYSAMLTKEIVLKLPPAALRVAVFELTPSAFVGELIVPLLSIIKEYEEGTFNDSTERRVKVESTFVVRAAETGFKGIKAGVFGVLPDPFSLLYDFASMEQDIARASQDEERLMHEMLGVLYAHMQKEIVNPDPNKSLEERLRDIATIKPLLIQMSEILGRRMNAFSSGISSREDVIVWLNTAVDEFRFNEFGVRSTEEVQAKGFLNGLRGLLD